MQLAGSRRHMRNDHKTPHAQNAFWLRLLSAQGRQLKLGRLIFALCNVYSMAMWPSYYANKGAFTPNVKSELIENLGGILGGTQCFQRVII